MIFSRNSRSDDDDICRKLFFYVNSFSCRCCCSNTSTQKKKRKVFMVDFNIANFIIIFGRITKKISNSQMDDDDCWIDSWIWFHQLIRVFRFFYFAQRILIINMKLYFNQTKFWMNKPYGTNEWIFNSQYEHKQRKREKDEKKMPKFQIQVCFFFCSENKIPLKFHCLAFLFFYCSSSLHTHLFLNSRFYILNS